MSLSREQIYLIKRRLKQEGNVQKFCNTCKTIKEINEFAIHTRTKNKIKYRGTCKVCVRGYNDIYYKHNGDEVRRRARVKYHERREAAKSSA